jgi:hypothetical protein
MKNILLILSTIAIITMSTAAHSSASWYVGKVARVALSAADGSFIVTFKNAALDDCQFKYANFNGSSLGEQRMKHAYSMAITSLTTGVDMGIVIDKAKNGPGGACDAYGMTADLRAN